MTGPWVGRVRALVEVDLGLVEQARAHAEEGLASARAFSQRSSPSLLSACWADWSSRSATSTAAAEYLRELPERLLAGGLNDPTQPVWADAIETLLALGELELARSYLEPYETNAQRLGSPRAAVGAARCRGLLSAAEGDSSAATAAFEALASPDAAPFPLERGPHPALPGHGAQTGAAEEGGARGARAGARDLRGAGRTALGGEGTSGAQADQRPAAAPPRS